MNVSVSVLSVRKSSYNIGFNYYLFRVTLFFIECNKF